MLIAAYIWSVCMFCRRLKESCTAYSDLRKKLDEVEEEKQEQRKKC